ncbi:MAG: FG-GAP repeat protein [Leptospiraceae bacterium]|nr:FG-GAP repeat protein [Leptospiraceae bacterium]
MKKFFLILLLFIFNCTVRENGVILDLLLSQQILNFLQLQSTSFQETSSTDLPPISLQYNGNPYSFSRTISITSIIPIYVGGSISSCTVTPTLPMGLTLSNTDCSISGTPTETLVSTNYTITAGNSSGSISTSITIGVEGIWIQEAYIKASNAESGDYFGESIAINGDTIAVTAWLESSNQTTITNGITSSTNNSFSQAGAVYVYKRTGTTWAQEAYIKASNAEAGDRFGEGISISGDTLVVGVKNEDSSQTTITNGTTSSSDNADSQAGAVYVYKRSGTTWAQEAYIKASSPGGLIGDQFGNSVSIDGDTIVVGAFREDSNQTTITNGTTSSANNSFIDSGAVFVYKRTGTNWAQEAYIKASNAQAGDLFGSSVSIFGDTIVVSAEGEDSNQTTITNGTTSSSDNSFLSSGAVYVYKRTGTNWAQEAYIKASNAQAGDRFGNVISISTDTIIVGTQYEDSNQSTITNGTTSSVDNSFINSGAVFVYKRTGTTWAQEAYLKASNTDAGDAFGCTGAISGETIVTGALSESSSQTIITNGPTASFDNSISESGAVYVFKRTGITWAQEAYIKASNAEANDYFGYKVAIFGDTIIVSAYSEASNQTTITNGATASSDNSAIDAGAVYVYRKL